MNEKGNKNKHEKEILKEEDKAVQGEEKNANTKKDEVIQTRNIISSLPPSFYHPTPLCSLPSLRLLISISDPG